MAGATISGGGTVSGGGTISGGGAAARAAEAERRLGSGVQQVLLLLTTLLPYNHHFSLSCNRTTFYLTTHLTTLLAH